ncbi:MAG: HNH endonuclease [Candidatus Saccharibacteria bacterium]|nr:HNH endonuclease [Moraxellaceae bacterium]
MSLSNKEIYDYLLKKRLKVEEWGTKGARGGNKKTLECVLGQHIFYLKVDVDRDHNFSFVFDPATPENIVTLLDKVKGCEIEKENIEGQIQWSYDHSTAFQTFDKKQNKGKNFINYGYRARFESVEALEDFLQFFLRDYSKKSLDINVPEFQFSKSESDSVEAIENNSNFNETERKAYIKIRIGQSSFRDYLKKHWGGCAVTGCTLIETLIASHIKPWHQCENEPQHRLNKFNGLLLTPNLDKLFDLGLISFENNGKIIVSEKILSDDYVFLGINAEMRLRNQLQGEHYPFLQYHRKAHGFEERCFPR